MKTVLQQRKKEISKVDFDSKESNSEVRIHEMISRYCIWFTNNNIEEFQNFCMFWNQKITNQSEVFLR